MNVLLSESFFLVEGHLSEHISHGKTDRRADEVSHKLSCSQPGEPGGSSVSTFTDGLHRAKSTHYVLFV